MAEGENRIKTLTIDLGRRKLPCWNMVLEQGVQLGVAPPPRLRNAEPDVYDTKRAAAEPEERTLLAPVPARRAQHPRHDDTANDVHDLIRHTCQCDGLSAETGRAYF